jgi:hypothetical protein
MYREMKKSFLKCRILCNSPERRYVLYTSVNRVLELLEELVSDPVGLFFL